MSKSATRGRSYARKCKGKIRYRSHDEAVRALHKQQNRGVPMSHAYECDGCSGFHLTSGGGQSRRERTVLALEQAISETLGEPVRVAHVNWGDSHRKMLLWNRRFERAYARSRRNQPPGRRRAAR